MEQGNPLVSIVVITYNSSKYVLETLESAKAQTYQNIELIVSDDYSTDNTVEICRNWLDENKERFVRTESVTVEKNTGIAPNCNRGCKIAKGEWVKIIAGDDILMENCVEDNIYEINNIGNNTVALFSPRLPFHENEEFTTPKKPKIFSLTDSDSKKDLLNIRFFGGVTIFIRKSIFNKIGYFDERYPFMEDYPFIYKVIHNGYDIEYFDKVTIKYRLYSGVSTNNKFIVHPLYFDSEYRFFKDVRKGEIKDKRTRLHVELQFWKWQMGLKYFGNKRTFGYKVFNKILNIFDSFIYKAK